MRLRAAAGGLAAVAALIAGGCGYGGGAVGEAAAPPPKAVVTVPAAPRVEVAASVSAQAIASAAPIATAEAPRCAPITPAPFELFAIDPSLNPPVPPLVDPDGKAMRAFYRKLARLVRGRAREPLRVAVFGDSNLTTDHFTGWLRRMLQERFGDAGHGYVASTRPWSWYSHQDVRHGSSGFRPYACSTHPVLDHAYGAAGIAGDSLQPNATMWVETAPAGSPVGVAASRADVHYLRRPKGGVFDVLVDGGVRAHVETAKATVEAAALRVEMQDGPHRVEVVARERDRSVRLFGIALERAVPGVIIDSFGVGGASCPSLAREDRAVTIAALRARGHDLVIHTIGSNNGNVDGLNACMKEVFARHREATPEAPILLFGPPDYVQGGADGQPMSDAMTRRSAEIARVEGAAFWDYRAAMGGRGAVLRFEAHNLVWTDHVHLTERGHHFMASRFLHALWEGLTRALEAEPALGCEDEAKP